MNLLFYMARPGGKGEELLRSLPVSVPGVGLEAVFDLESFSERLRKPRDPASIALIWDPSREDLRSIGVMKGLLRGGRTLLVLTDQEKDTIALAHVLLPAFITYVDDGSAEILSVLKKLAGTYAGDKRPGISS